MTGNDTENPDTPSSAVIVSFPAHLAADPIAIRIRDETVNLSQEASNFVRAIARKTGSDEVLVIERLLVHCSRVLQTEDPDALELAIRDREDA